MTNVSFQMEDTWSEEVTKYAQLWFLIKTSFLESTIRKIVLYKMCLCKKRTSKVGYWITFFPYVIFFKIKSQKSISK